MFGHVLAQTWNDQNGGGSLQFVHGQHLRFLDNSTGCFRQRLFVGSTLNCAHPKRFTLDVRHFSFDDKLSDTRTRDRRSKNPAGWRKVTVING
jgi:hypothetical protein